MRYQIQLSITLKYGNKLYAIQIIKAILERLNYFCSHILIYIDELLKINANNYNVNQLHF